MSLKFAKIVSLTAVLGAAGVSLWARGLLPDAPVATHFDASGHVNGTMPRDVALVFGPAAALSIALVMLWLLPVIMPKKATLARSSEAYGASVIIIVVFLCLIHAGLIVHALNAPIDLPRWALGGVGLLFLVIGNYLPKTRFNYVMGVRTPWTLSSEEVWDRTHRLAGPLHMALGALVLADAVLTPFPLAYMLMIGGVVIVTAISVIYSYIAAKRLNLA